MPPPPGVPAGLGSPRKALRTFLESMDELEFDGDRSRGPPGLPRPRARSREDDRAGVGLRLAAKLEAVLRRLGVDLLTVADTWEADPLVLGRDTEWQVTLARGRTAPGGSTARPSPACPTCSSGSRPRRRRPASAARTSTRRSRP